MNNLEIRIPGDGNVLTSTYVMNSNGWYLEDFDHLSEVIWEEGWLVREDQ